jgi:Ca-activated chloride channel family protein
VSKLLRAFALPASVFGLLTGLLGCLLIMQSASFRLHAQEPDPSIFHVKVDMVVLGFTVTDTKGKYVNGLKPKDFKVYEDDLPEKPATFAEGDHPPLQVLENGEMKPLHTAAVPTGPGGAPDPGVIDLRPETAGANIFVLFDTSNYMYRGFVYASDAIADFIRGLDRADSVAVYTYSRNLNRSVPLNRDRGLAINGLRRAVAGDDSALYNALLLTLRDAARVPGRKVVIVFSNGPDNASMVAPDDVRAVAEDEGIPIYVISTSEVTKDPISSSIFKRISTTTGGKSYFAKTWQKQVEAFESIREDLGNSYTVTYYPQPNPNEGFRKIRIELTSDAMRKFKVRARPGYRPQRGF